MHIDWPQRGEDDPFYDEGRIRLLYEWCMFFNLVYMGFMHSGVFKGIVCFVVCSTIL